MLRPVTLKILAELADGPKKFQIGVLVGHHDKYAIAAQFEDKRISIVVDGKTLLEFCALAKKYVEET